MAAGSAGNVRAARRGDLSELVDLRMHYLGQSAHLEPRLRLLPDARQRTEQALPVWIGQPDRILLVAEGGGEAAEGEAPTTLVGYAMGLLVLWPPVFQNQHVGEISECYVRSAARGQGHGRALVDRLSSVLIGRGADVLRAHVPVSNEAAGARLAASGYRPLQRIMERRLSSL